MIEIYYFELRQLYLIMKFFSLFFWASRNQIDEFKLEICFSQFVINVFRLGIYVGNISELFDVNCILANSTTLYER